MLTKFCVCKSERGANSLHGVQQGNKYYCSRHRAARPHGLDLSLVRKTAYILEEEEKNLCKCIQLSV